MKLGRNDPCHCGSGSKYKKCCWTKDIAARSAELEAEASARAAAAAEPADPEPKGGKPARTSPRGAGPIRAPKGAPVPKSSAQMRKRAV